MTEIEEFLATNDVCVDYEFVRDEKFFICTVGKVWCTAPDALQAIKLVMEKMKI